LRLLHRRPSPALAISLVALFMSLGGVGYAATQLPNGSVGTAQLRKNAVTNSKIKQSAVSYKKIQPGAVGTVRANLNQLQARVSGTCTGNQAISTVNQIGKVTCANTLPSEFGTSSNSAAVTASPATISSVALPTGATYLGFANPTASVSNGATSQHVTVTCTLTVGSNTQTRDVTLNTNNSGTGTQDASIPLQAAGSAGNASVACAGAVDGGTLPAINVTSAINAIQTASNS
jgi:hypothetical protein